MALTKIPLKEINRLAIPAIFAGIVDPLIALTDAAVAGNLQQNGARALAAVGVVGSFLSALIWILAQTRAATSTLVSQYLGSGRLTRVQGLLPQVFLFNFLLSLLISIALLPFSSLIFKTFFQVQGLTLSYCLSYFRIRIWGFPLTLVTFAIFGVFRGLQNTSWAMQISLIGGLLNAGLDWLFAYGLHWGVPGVAYASLCAQLVMFGLAGVYFFSKTSGYLLLRGKLHPEFKPWLAISFNLFIRTAALEIAIVLANRFAASYGTAALAAQSILMNLWLFSAFFIDGYAAAGNAIAGKLLGGRDYRKLWLLGIDLGKYSAGVALALALCYAIGYYPIGRIFTGETLVLERFYRVFWLVILMQPLNALAFTFDEIYKGLGKAVFLRNLLLAATFLGFIPTLYLTDYLGWGLYAVWIAFSIWMLVRMLGLWFNFKSAYSQNKSYA
ncbi:MAG: MATE family efflux transporter [Flavobacteriales bacterium]